MRVALVLAFLVACSDSPGPRRTEDAGADAAIRDAGRDAGFEPPDAGDVDAGSDAGVDAGPTCECSSGPCCDGCHVRPNTFVCQNDEVVGTTCVGVSVCPSKGLLFRTRYESRRCDGFVTTCAGSTFGDHVVDVNCDSSQGFPMAARCEAPAVGDAYCTWGPNCSTEHP